MAYDPAFRAEVIAFAQKNAGDSADAVGRRFGVPGRTVRKWLAAEKGRPSKKTGKRKTRSQVRNEREGGQRSPGGPPSRAREPEPLTKRGGKRPRARAPADTLPRDDRDDALVIVRRARSVARRYLDHLEDQLDRWESEMERIAELEDPEERLKAMRKNPLPKVNREETQGILNLQKTAAEVLDTHPGLMEIAAERGDKSDDRAARRARVRAALGLPETDQ